MVQTGITTDAVMILMGTAAIFSFILTTELFPQQLAQAVLSVTDNNIIILLLVNVVLLVFGMFLDLIPTF